MCVQYNLYEVCDSRCCDRSVPPDLQHRARGWRGWLHLLLLIRLLQRAAALSRYYLTELDHTECICTQLHHFVLLTHKVPAG